MHSFFEADPNVSFVENFYRIIQHRKSIRQFKADLISEEKIKRILESAAVHAPSGKNRQNWRFFVLQGAKKDEYLKYSQQSWDRVREVLQKRLKPSLYQFTERFFYTLGGAPVVILAYSENSPEEKDLTSIGSVYMAVQNINLACVAEGLGCCTMGAPLELKDDVNDFIQSSLPKHSGLKIGGSDGLQLLCGLAIGIPDHEPPKAPRQLEGRITWLG